MNNGSNEILEAKVIERDERAKKLYRYVSDVARRVSEMTASSRSLVDLFSVSVEVQRQKLRDNCEKLMFLDPLNYGKKSLELLWRKVYYDTVSIAKKLRETDSNNNSCLYTHIECGIGNFHNFIDRLQLKMKIQLKDLDYAPITEDEETGEANETPTYEELQFYQSAVHSCLIYLGDLSRYQVEIFQTFDPSVAARYYLQAAHVDLVLGMPYNQLGNLYLDKNYNLDSVCYYIHCLNCVSPFEGAMGNLTKIFEKNIQFNEAINESEILTQTEHIQNMITNFLSLIEIWYLGKNDTNIPQRCNKLVHELKICMDFDKTILPDINKNYNEYKQAKDEESTNPTYLNANIIHKIVQICLFTVVKMNETDETKAFACKAFTLAFLSQLLQKLLNQLQLMGLAYPVSKYNSRYSNHVESDHKQEEKVESVTNTDTSIVNGENYIEADKLLQNECLESNKVHNGYTKNNIKKSLTKRRRRRRLLSSGSSDVSDADTNSSNIETDESCSDEEDLSESTYQSDGNVQSDGTDYEGSETEAIIGQDNGEVEQKPVQAPTQPNTDTIVEKSTMTSNKDKDSKFNSTIAVMELNVLELQQFLQGDNFLPSIKLLLDWVLLEKDLILSCGNSGESLFQCIVDLLNIFNYYFASKTNDLMEKECQILKYATRVSKKLKLEYKTIPLPEDIDLRGTNICKFDKDAAEWGILQKYRLTVYDENIIRILNFIDFGNQMAKIIPRIRYNRSINVFYLKKNMPPKLNTKMNHKRSREWHNSKKSHIESSEGGLLRRLGHLWLASQVRELESSGQSATPAFLVLDTASLNKHLRRVKQLLRARTFILLVPTVVLQELDNLKREQSTARDAIRWLEMQLRSGSRFLRAQRPGQSKPLSLLKYPRKAPQHVHNFIQILEFCNHFISDEKQMQGGNGDSDTWPQGKSAPLLILLLGNETGDDEEQYKDFSVTGAAEAAGISIEQIGQFYMKWRQSAHKNGKKR